MEEIWKDIEGYDWLYQVSSLWRVKSLKFWKEVILVWCKLKHWHKQVQLFLNWKSTVTKKLIHRLVAEYFIPNPYNLPCVCHRSEILDIKWCLYNWVDNLFWWTHQDNMRDMVNKWRASDHLLKNNYMKWKFWKYCKNSKKVNQYTKDLEFIKQWDSIMDVKRELWLSNSWISNCCRWKIYKSVGGFKWSYTNITQ